MSDDLLSIFWQEVSDYLGGLNDALLKVEMLEGEERRLLLKEMNRVAHSLKGAARAVGLGMVETLAHYMEEIFHQALATHSGIDPELADSLYDSLDHIQTLMDGGSADDSVVTEVMSVLERAVVVNAQKYPQAPPSSKKRSADPASEQDSDPPAPATANGKPATATPNPTSKPKPKLKKLATPAVADDSAAPVSSSGGDGNEGGDGNAPAKPAPSTPSTPSFAPPSANLLDSQTMVMRPMEESLRVPVDKLNQLMADASELLVAKMQMETRQTRLNDLRKQLARWGREWRAIRAAYIRLARRLQEGAQAPDALPPEVGIMMRFLESNQRYLNQANRELTQLAQATSQSNLQLATLTERLQEDVANLRMMPFDSMVGAFQRLVRDTARDLGKQAVLDVEGAHVEIDKTVLEALKDPLLHLLRNALDHAIETPQARIMADKAPLGRIVLAVEQRGNEIVIQVRDDGRGIDPVHVRQRAVQRGLISQAEADLLNDDEARLLIFSSGFSTTEQVTALSGRGLGMDIVRGRIEALRGRVSLASVLGQGTSVTLRVPVSLTRLRCILLSVGGEEYAVPSVMVARMATLQRDAIYHAGGREMVNLNDQAVPLVALSSLLGVPSHADEDAQVRLIALQSAERVVAFEVDELVSEMELVLKPLGREVAGVVGIAGAALLGSGDVILVLDANDLVRQALGEALRPRLRLNISESAPRRRRVLVVDDSITTRTLEKNILEAVGFEVTVAVDGVEAWSAVLETLPDVVVSDVEMPNMNGLELTRQIKGDARTQHLPVILLTSLSKPEQQEAGLRAGANAYLVKSRFDQRELLETIQAVL
jgi:two-component system chemotaxis sensor kinase CheA